jgi:endonuclease/exonuclease/phosphatase family metal-dependent hydrolase
MGTIPRTITLFATAAMVTAAACAAPGLRPSPVATPCRAEADERAGVRWVRAAPPSDRTRLDAWCASVGPAVVAPASAAARAMADSFVVVTWNVNLGGGDVEAFVRDLRAGAFTDGAPVEHFVLLLQEAYRDGAAVPALPAGAAPRRIAPSAGQAGRTGVTALAERLDLSLLYVPSMRNGRRVHDPPEDRGNAILASLPLREATAIELPFEWQRRVAAAATVVATDSRGVEWPLRVASVHLDVRSRFARGTASLGAARTRQAAAVVAALEGHAHAVVGGDLNNWGFPALEAAPRVFRDAFPHMSAVPEPTFTAAAGLFQRRLDHLFLRAAGPTPRAPLRVASRYGSDHHPVLGWVRADAL